MAIKIKSVFIFAAVGVKSDHVHSEKADQVYTCCQLNCQCITAIMRTKVHTSQPLHYTDTDTDTDTVIVA